MSTFFLNLLAKSRLTSSVSRTLRRSAIRLNTEKVSDNHRVNNLEKRFLVWTGKYKKVEDVPGYVAQAVVERARNRMRIRIANITMVLTLVACVVMVITGKRARDRGETVQQYNLDWHNEYNKTHSKE